MQSVGYKPIALALLFLLGLASGASAQQVKHKKHEKLDKDRNVWSYDGGVFFETDGSLPDGVCFRVHGQMSSEDFFNGLRRIDTDQATFFERGNETVTKFPDSVTVSFSIRDQLCPAGVVGTRPYLTEKIIADLRLSLYWKDGVDLSPVKGVKEINSRVDRIQPYAVSLAADLPARYEWSYQFAVPSAGVSLMDSLAFVFRTPDGRIAARVAARL
ncbi:MAG TPA: hypothetical protein VHM93_14135 [Candidatus Acidoferrum sp.]|jgi:hypothetical protein|nr:hypothetical protein [Candidatus Acidoferrum sp.]